MTEGNPRKGCLARLLGCLGVALGCIVVFVVLFNILPGWDAGAKRNAVRPGMTPSQVLVIAQGWLSCQASVNPASGNAKRLSLWPSRLMFASGEIIPTSGVEELGRALEDEMKRTQGPWTLSFGYLTIIPRRIYFTVEFGPDGRVARVGEPRWGTLD